LNIYEQGRDVFECPSACMFAYLFDKTHQSITQHVSAMKWRKCFSATTKD
jgi:hypothetical protein